ncbi:MAG: hypothetical protein AAFR61_02570 [Bacteroidota bacterium]
MEKGLDIRIPLYWGWGLLLLTAGVYLWWISQIESGFQPLWSDEIIYVLNAQAQYETGETAAAFTFNGTGAKVGGADAHGPVYPWLHASMAHLFGWSDRLMMWLQAAFVLLSLLAFWRWSALSWVKKQGFSLLLLLFPFLPLYGFTFMQEGWQIGLAVWFVLWLEKMAADRPSAFVFWGGLIGLILAGLLRPIWMMGGLALLPLAGNMRERLTYGGIFLLGSLASFWWVTTFYEPLPNYFSELIASLNTQGVMAFLLGLGDHFLDNLGTYFTTSTRDPIGNWLKFSPFILLMGVGWIAWLDKKRETLALLLWMAWVFFLLFAIYDAYDWRDIRILGPLNVLGIYVMVKKSPGFALGHGLFSLVMVSALCLHHPWIYERNEPRPSVEVAALPSELVEETSPTAITIKGPLSPEPHILLYLPLQTPAGGPIRYLLPYYEVDQLPTQWSFHHQGNQGYWLRKGQAEP